MSYVDRVLTAMRPECIYRVCDLSNSTHLPVDEVRRVLKLLERGMLVEIIKTDEYRRKRLYKTKQRRLF